MGDKDDTLKHLTTQGWESLYSLSKSVRGNVAIVTASRGMRAATKVLGRNFHDLPPRWVKLEPGTPEPHGRGGTKRHMAPKL